MEVISAWELYLWTRLDSLQGLADFSLGSCIVLITTLAFAYMMNHITEDSFKDYSKREDSTLYRDYWKAAKAKTVILKAIKPLIIAAFVFGFLSAVIPSKKDAAMIYVIPKIVNNQEVQDGAKQVVGEAKEIYDIAKSALKEYAGVKDE